MYFVEVSVDIDAGDNYLLMGSTQLRSVPYALFAETSENPGNPGPQGEQGEQGPVGAQGLQGPLALQVSKAHKVIWVLWSRWRAGPSRYINTISEIIDSELFVTFDNGTIQNAGIINIPGGSIVLDPDQYIFSFNSTFGQLELEITDPAILDSYIRLGISVRVYDNTGSSVYSNNFITFMLETQQIWRAFYL